MSGKNGRILIKNLKADAAVTVDTDSAAIDCTGYDALTISFRVGTNTDAVGLLVAKYSDDGTNYFAVPAEETFSTDQMTLAAAKDNVDEQMGIVVKHKFYKGTIDITSATTGAVVGITGVLGNSNIGT